MWHKPCRTFHPWCQCIKARCLSVSVMQLNFCREGITEYSSQYWREAHVVTNILAWFMFVCISVCEVCFDTVWFEILDNAKKIISGCTINYSFIVATQFMWKAPRHCIGTNTFRREFKYLRIICTCYVDLTGGVPLQRGQFLSPDSLAKGVFFTKTPKIGILGLN